MKQYDIDEIKSLLEAYYDGATTIEQEKLLCDFFTSTTEIPAELECDKQIFNSLHSTNINKFKIPDNLENKLISHIDNLEKNEQNNRKKWILPFTIISVAACIILLLALGVKFININSELIDNEIILISESNSNDTVEHNTYYISEIEHQEPVLAKETPVKKEAKQKKRAKRQQTVKSNQIKSITDEKIAYENTERALLLLSEKLNIAQRGVKQTESTINEINNTITDII